MERLRDGIVQVGAEIAEKGRVVFKKDTPEENHIFFQDLLARADIRINPSEESRPWDITVNNPAFYTRVLRDGVSGAAEGYVKGEWDSEDIAALTDRVYRANLADNLSSDKTAVVRLALQRARQKLDRDEIDKVAKKHYDLPPLLFERMLDEREVYSCAYWPEGVETLDQAQEAKLDLIARKLHLEPGMRVLDIGGGAGGLAAYLAEYYGVSVVNTGISKEQIDTASRKYADLPVENRFQDYREINDGPYDRIVSVGMFEHVGKRPRNYKRFMGVVERNLAENGIFLLHTIGTHVAKAATSTKWVSENIFPNSRVPTHTQISKAIGDKFVVHQLEDIGPHYDPTLLAWNDNFERHWEELKPLFGEKPEEFRRKWRLYLLGSAGMFRSGRLQVWQIAMTKPGTHYEAVRHDDDGSSQKPDAADLALFHHPSGQTLAQD